MTGDLEEALLAAAAGLLHEAAAAGLLIGSGTFLHRGDFTAFTQASPGTGSSPPLAWIDWDDAVTALGDGRLPASSGEASVLRLAASLATGNPVSLLDTATRLDHRNLALLTNAIRHAAGHH